MGFIKKNASLKNDGKFFEGIAGSSNLKAYLEKKEPVAAKAELYDTEVTDGLMRSDLNQANSNI